MKHPFSHLPLAALSLATAALLAACGGSNAPGTGPTTISGQVIDGYIKGATVCLDLNGNYACDSGEPSATSGDKGAYSFTAPAGVDIRALHVVAKVPVGATDTDNNGTATKVTDPYIMLSPATMASVVSPLTTVVSTEMKNGKDVGAARIAARSELGMNEYYDFMADHVKTNDLAVINAAKAMAGELASALSRKAPSGDAFKTALLSYAARKAAGGGAGNAGGGNLHIDVYGPTALKVSLISPAGGGNAGGGNAGGGNAGGGNAGSGNAGGGTPFVGTSKVTFEADDSPDAVLQPGWNGATSSVEAFPPAGGNGKAGKLVVADQSRYHGATFLVLTNNEACSATNPNISIRVHTPATGTAVELKLEQDGDPTKNIELLKRTTVAGWETLTFNCTLAADHAVFNGNPTAPYVEATVYNKVSILFDMPNPSAGTKTYYFDDVSYTPTAAVTYVAPVAGAAPTTAPADPTKAPANVKSLYSDTYTNLDGIDWNPSWSQSTVVSEVTVGTNKIRKYASMNYQGVVLAADTDVSAFANLHIDIYNTGSSKPVKIYVISTTDGTKDSESFTATLTATGWNSFDIPMTTYSLVDKTKVKQFKFGFDADSNYRGTVYYDNLYFWK